MKPTSFLLLPFLLAPPALGAAAPGAAAEVFARYLEYFAPIWAAPPPAPPGRAP